ncbi:MAG TPA: transcription elongation factor GreA [bacterium]|nr:transcription elongation factor GreA [bacterium]HOL48311.1 transcription elongation factor GreA [bacterium]HPQ19788.1 transcription elongation factor GreA [bacterium]
MQKILMTKENYEKIKAQIKELEAEKPKVIQAISDARDLGDLSENAEYHSARERLSHIEAKISYLSAQLNNAEIVSVENINTNEVSFGTTVKLLDLTNNEELELTIVSAGDADPDKNQISVNSPLAKNLLGKKINDEIKVKLPLGDVTYKILNISIK